MTSTGNETTTVASTTTNTDELFNNRSTNNNNDNNTQKYRYLTGTHQWRLMVQEQLSRFNFYNNIKGGYKGAHARDIIRIVNRFKEVTNYNFTESERRVFRKAQLTTYGLAALGFCMPLSILIVKPIRDIANTARKKKAIFVASCALGYGNYVGSYSSYLQNVLALDNSCMAYAAFQVMCQPDYRQFRNRWQTIYNLSAIAHRYQRFDFEFEMEKILTVYKV